MKVLARDMTAPSFSMPAPAQPRMPSPTAQTLVDTCPAQGTTELFGISEMCRTFGVTLRALRLYEDKGLLAPLRINGARVYTRRDRARLSLILRAKALGSSLTEIKRYLDLYGEHGEGLVQQVNYVMRRTGSEIAALEKQRMQIEKSLSELRTIHSGCINYLASQMPGQNL